MREVKRGGKKRKYIFVGQSGVLISERKKVSKTEKERTVESNISLPKSTSS